MAQCVNYDIRPWQFVKSKRKNCKQRCQIKAKLLLQGHLTTWDQNDPAYLLLSIKYDNCCRKFNTAFELIWILHTRRLNLRNKFQFLKTRFTCITDITTNQKPYH